MEPYEIKSETPRLNKDNFDKKIDFIEELTIKKGIEEYKIQFGIIANKDTLILKVENQNSKDLSYYQQYYSVNELHNLSNLFSFYKTAKDIISFLKTLEAEVVDKNNLLIIRFKAFKPNGENSIIELELKKKSKNLNEMIKNLFQEIKSIKENTKAEISTIKNKHETEIKELKNVISLYQNEISTLKTNIQGYKTEISNTKIENKKLWEEIVQLKKINEKTSIFMKSKITFIDFKTINSIKAIDFILDYIRQNDTNFIFNNLKLLYRGSRDGDKTKICHQLCDNKNNILIIIQSDNGYTFGGYSKIGFKTDNNQGNYLIDNNSFLFSMNLRKIYPSIKDKTVICHIGDQFGLCFNSSLIFYDNYMTTGNNVIYPQIKNKFNGLENEYEMNGGKNSFLVKELEVFQLL